MTLLLRITELLTSRVIPTLRGWQFASSEAEVRNLRAALSGGVAVLARIVQLLTSLVTIPFALNYLGTERFGLWMTINSLLAMVAFADFGVGNGVLNTVARAFGQDDVIGIRRAISSGVITLSIIASSILGVFLVVYPHVNWAQVFRVTSQLAKEEAGPTLLIFCVAIALNIVLDVVQRVQLGIQQGYRYGLWQMGGSLGALAGVLAGIQLHAGLPVLVIALAGAPLVFTLMNAVHFFVISRPDLRPSLLFVSRNVIFQIARLGSLFFILQLVGAIAFSADNLIIARVLGAKTVPEYAVPQRIFSLISMLIAVLITPLWPAYGEATSRGDLVWVRGTLKRSVLIVFALSGSAAVVLLFMSHRLLAVWVGPQIQPSLLMLVGLAIWSVMESVGQALAMFLNGASIMRLQLVIAVVFGVGCLILKVMLINVYGVAALPWATIATYAVLTLFPYAILMPRLLNSLERKISVSGVG